MFKSSRWVPESTALLGERVFAGVTNTGQGRAGVGWAPSTMAGVRTRRGETETHREEHLMMRGQSDMAVRQGPLRTETTTSSQRKDLGHIAPPNQQEEPPRGHPSFRLLAPRTVTEHPLMLGSLVMQPQDTNPGGPGLSGGRH